MEIDGLFKGLSNMTKFISNIPILSCDNSFSNCSNLTSVEIDVSNCNRFAHAFENTSLSNIDFIFPLNEKADYNSAFCNFRSRINVIYYNINSFNSISMFANCNISNLVIDANSSFRIDVANIFPNSHIDNLYTNNIAIRATSIQSQEISINNFIANEDLNQTYRVYAASSPHCFPIAHNVSGNFCNTDIRLNTTLFSYSNMNVSANIGSIFLNGVYMINLTSPYSADIFSCPQINFYLINSNSYTNDFRMNLANSANVKNLYFDMNFRNIQLMGNIDKLPRISNVNIISLISVGADEIDFEFKTNVLQCKHNLYCNNCNLTNVKQLQMFQIISSTMSHLYVNDTLNLGNVEISVFNNSGIQKNDYEGALGLGENIRNLDISNAKLSYSGVTYISKLFLGSSFENLTSDSVNSLTNFMLNIPLANISSPCRNLNYLNNYSPLYLTNLNLKNYPEQYNQLVNYGWYGF